MAKVKLLPTATLLIFGGAVLVTPADAQRFIIRVPVRVPVPVAPIVVPKSYSVPRSLNVPRAYDLPGSFEVPGSYRMPGYHRVPGAYGVSGSLKFQDSDAMQRAHDILRANGVSSQVLKALEKQRADEMQTTLELMKAVAGSKAVNLGGGFKPRSFGISSLPVPAPSVEPLPVRQPRSLSSRRIVRAYAGESLKRFVRY